jgi:hypothetical protein
VDKLAPFDHEGKQAYRVYVFKCADGKEFVSHMERYTPEAKKRIEEMRAQQASGNAPPNPMMFEGIMMAGVEVKDPGAKDWIRQSDFARAQKVMAPVCADGQRKGLQAVFPE